ncbi:hypothetical protein [Alienimonas chondri]|uniref:Thiamine-binding protein domain-containing protein n=1 Tax=Alienimonas chondri TaxID=2681879 RepID=A0ABX1VD66_9PLAN|nr:hypothetical protein [Alienimonas chondri]NNJ26052.1 hypothetical protein [Alienimonas chondri]
MPTHHFTVHPVPAEDHYDRFDEIGDRLWEAGCDDATYGMTCGKITIPFHREAATFQEAVRSAVAAVRSVGLEVDRVELDRDDLALMLGETTIEERLKRRESADEPAVAAAVSGMN